jgi:hypothetical protein
VEGGGRRARRKKRKGRMFKANAFSELQNERATAWGGGGASFEGGCASDSRREKERERERER